MADPTSYGRILAFMQGIFMLRCVIVLLLSFSVFRAPAQDTSGLKKTVIAVEAGAHGLGLSAEWNASGIFTVETAASYGPSYDVDAVEWFPFLNVFPAYGKAAARFSVNPRFYITRQRERQGATKNKHRIEQYFGLTYAYVTKAFNHYYPATSLVNLHYGMRQEALPRLLFTAYGGIGWAGNHETGFTTLYPALNIKFGYILNR